mmetsp:Transcript_24954/g.72988  ORF Transcript_24954/g.72988 Transcript_24954/m.72988 type:complete len:175 (+) Transcript_24954:113-637(+)|eukprot:CAMPEP_0118962870 /NCGR_PEP_ID=MMETSP1173-20130426/1042_1 /TAXON_ID=1034831 /ORGANISM="Rhizochromulina marina cf, Strain CCMP1243" /LENGTH=174 /DNA_ID=CAMNT_0006911177 /DNA_START=108 /DNA_END=632 /DNA_ORIENTATION=+
MDVADLSFEHGQELQIREVLERGQAAAGLSVKLLGVVEDHRMAEFLAVLRLEESSIPVRTTRISGEPLVEGRLVFIIGELVLYGGGLVLDGRVATSAQGLDVRLWGQALAARQAFLQEVTPSAHQGRRSATSHALARGPNHPRTGSIVPLLGGHEAPPTQGGSREVGGGSAGVF